MTFEVSVLVILCLKYMVHFRAQARARLTLQRATPKEVVHMSHGGALLTLTKAVFIASKDVLLTVPLQFFKFLSHGRPWGPWCPTT